MISVDVRTRTANDVRSVDPSSFFGEELPGLLREHAGLAAPGAAELGVRPLAFDVDGQAWTLSFDGEAFAIAAGDGGASAIVYLDGEGLDDLVNDLRTPMGFFTGGDLTIAYDLTDDWAVRELTIVVRAGEALRPTAQALVESLRAG